jgi:hypothetical protein
VTHVPVYAPADVRVSRMRCATSVTMVSSRAASNAPAAMMHRCMAGAMPATMMRHRVTPAMSATVSAAVAAASGGCHSRDHEQRGYCGND